MMKVSDQFKFGYELIKYYKEISEIAKECLIGQRIEPENIRLYFDQILVKIILEDLKKERDLDRVEIMFHLIFILSEGNIFIV